MNKAEIILNWEQDADIPTRYFKITENGTMIIYDVETEDIYAYQIS